MSDLYDTLGVGKDADAEAIKANSMLASLVVSMINEANIDDYAIDHTDLSANLKEALKRVRANHATDKANTERLIARAEKMARKWSRKKAKKGKDETPDLIGAMFASQIAGMRQRIVSIERQERITGRVQEMLEGYAYLFEPKERDPYASMGLGSGSPTLDMLFKHCSKGGGWR